MMPLAATMPVRALGGVTGNRTIPLKNPAIRHHLDVFSSARNYDPLNAGVAADLMVFRGPIDPVIERLDPMLVSPIGLGDQEFRSLIEFVRDGLLDKRAQPEHFRSLVPERVPSGHAPLVSEFEKILQ